MTGTHMIRISPFNGRVVVRCGGEVIAESQQAVQLFEGSTQPVFYIPQEEFKPGSLVASQHHTRCPFKGEASYFSVQGGGKVETDACWYYPTPVDAAKGIAGMLAFYTNRVSVEAVAGDAARMGGA